MRRTHPRITVALGSRRIHTVCTEINTRRGGSLTEYHLRVVTLESLRLSDGDALRPGHHSLPLQQLLLSLSSTSFITTLICWILADYGQLLPTMGAARTC